MRDHKDYYLAIDCTGYSSFYQGGVGEYTKNIVEALVQTNEEKKQIIILCAPESYEELKVLNDERVTVIQIIPRWFLVTRILMSCSYYIFGSTKLLRLGQRVRWKEARKLVNSRCKFVYTPTTYSNFPIDVESLVSLHDIQEKTFPNFFSARVLKYRNVSVRNTLEIASAIQVSSDFVRNEIILHYNSLSRFMNFVKIEEGVKLDESRNAFDPETKLDSEIKIVLPANFWEHKNQKVIIDAILDLEIPIVVVFTGQLFSIGLQLQDFAKSSHYEKFEFKGFIPRRELINIYINSNLVVSTSLYESSSLPILEGISFGCIPLASNIPAHVEMSKYFHMFLFDPNDTNSLKEALMRFHSLSYKEKLKLIRENLTAIENFDWRNQAKKYWDFTELSLK
jgi:glycosyltransferase involved in cell wall biosynthesis